MNVKEIAIKAKAASRELAPISTAQKNSALASMQEGLMKNREMILQANREDIAQAQTNGLSEAMIDRLSLQNRLESIIQDIGEVIQLPDPIGGQFDKRTLPNGLHRVKCRVPLGVLGNICQSRPNVTIDVSALTIKSGNCAILRGGSETLNTNRAIVAVIQEAVDKTGLPADTIQLIASEDRAHVREMLRLHEHIDMIIPRGSAALQQFCRETSTIPVIMGGSGICHLFVDATADPARSIDVIANAKAQRPTVCNALDTLLVHKEVAPKLMANLVQTLADKGVRFRLDQKAMRFISHPSCSLASDEDWEKEWLSLVLGIKIVDEIDEAIAHIQLYSSGHSDGILTEEGANADRFVREIDSAAVYVNASTRFTDGGQLGLGAEVANSTQKLHARGPMGLEELTSYKWVVRGNYHVRK